MSVKENERFLKTRETARGTVITIVFEGDANSTLENENLQRNDPCPEHSGFYISDSEEADIPKGTSKKTFSVRAFKVHSQWSHP